MFKSCLQRLTPNGSSSELSCRMIRQPLSLVRLMCHCVWCSFCFFRVSLFLLLVLSCDVSSSFTYMQYFTFLVVFFLVCLFFLCPQLLSFLFSSPFYGPEHAHFPLQVCLWACLATQGHAGHSGSGERGRTISHHERTITPPGLPILLFLPPRSHAPPHHVGVGAGKPVTCCNFPRGSAASPPLL